MKRGGQGLRQGYSPNCEEAGRAPAAEGRAADEEGRGANLMAATTTCVAGAIARTTQTPLTITKPHQAQPHRPVELPASDSA